MIDLDDPLWLKLDDAHRDRDIPKAIAGLARAWDDEAAASLFWDCLCHQGTCYGATYAAVPHLLALAEGTRNRQSRAEIALFLGRIALVAFVPSACCAGVPDGAVPQGLPLDTAAWDRKLDVYRSLARHAEEDLSDRDALRRAVDYARSPSRRQASGVVADMLSRIMGKLDPDLIRETEQIEIVDPVVTAERDLARYREILSRPAIDNADLAQIAAIRAEFFDALPAIRDLCADVYREDWHGDAARYLLAGVAAAGGARGMAHLMEAEEGESVGAACSRCSAHYVCAGWPDGIAVYATPTDPEGIEAWSAGQNPDHLDWKDGRPGRAHLRIMPFDGSPADLPGPKAEVLRLAEEMRDREGALALRRAAGRFRCPACGRDAELVHP